MRRSLPLLLAAIPAAGILAIPPPAAGGTLAASYLLSSDADLLDCFVLNVGKRAVELVSGRVVDTAGMDITNASSCTGSLAPGGKCSFTSTSGTTFAAGILEVRGSARNLRGSCQLTNFSNEAVAVTEMR
jgi:hypothetical protein